MEKRCCKCRFTWPIIWFRGKSKQCKWCKVLSNLYSGLWSRLKHSPHYVHLPKTSVIGRDEFHRWGVTELIAFMGRHPAERPSVNRIDPSKTYESGNLEIIGKRRNAGMTRLRCFWSDATVRRIRSLARQGVRRTTLARQFGCSIPTVSRCVRRITYTHIT